MNQRVITPERMEQIQAFATDASARATEVGKVVVGTLITGALHAAGAAMVMVEHLYNSKRNLWLHSGDGE